MRKEISNKALVLTSGGLDSTTALAMAVKAFGNKNVVSLSVVYGQKHKKELQAARNVAEYYGVEHRELDLTQIFRGSDCALLEGSAEEVPHEDYKTQTDESGGDPVKTYVPFRNGLFLSVAACIAYACGCDTIVCGIHRDDAAGNAYPDCGAEFNAAMAKAVLLGTGERVSLYSPFVGQTKADIVRIGLELGVPYDLTWSCYEGGEKPCGKCGTCIDRAKAFEKNGVKDPAL